MKKVDVVENTGHDAKGAEGLDYQFLYFVNRLLKMVDKRDIVSYEKHDDVSMFSGETLVYYQLKEALKNRLIFDYETVTCGRLYRFGLI